ncbi:MAG: DUF2807 domain-containing protein [Bacteroidales bacterium]|nr:DUF2807 domain-containing protein [Bacteroidales bacterium]
MKKYRITLFTISTLLIFSLYSCSDIWNDCLQGNGILTEEERIEDDFTGIELTGSMDVEVTIGNDFYVSVEADDNLQRYIITRTRGDRLYIETDRNRCIRSRNPIVVHVTLPYLEYLGITGSGIIDCNYVNTDFLQLYISGSGDIYADVTVEDLQADITGSGEIKLWGEVINGDLSITGSGKIRAFSCQFDECNATITGSGDIYAFVYDILNVNISGSGNVYYRGNPDIYSSITGSGHIVNSN